MIVPIYNSEVAPPYVSILSLIRDENMKKDD